MKNKATAFLFFMLLSCITQLGAQIYNPVTWSYSQEKAGDGTFLLHFSASIEKGWHIYALHLPSDEGPVATSFTFTESDDFRLVGDVTQPKPITEYDPNFDMALNYFENGVVFTQKLKANKLPLTIEGELTYMVCDASKCLPPEYIPFTFNLKAEEKATETGVQDEDSGKVEETINEASEGESTGMEGASSETIYDPVTWSYEGQLEADGSGKLIFKASIQPGWHMYSQHLASDEGPVATSFSLDSTASWDLAGAVAEDGDKTETFDPIFEMELAYFEHEAVFTVPIEVHGDTATISGEFTFMVCDATKCLPPAYIPFTFRASEGQLTYVPQKEETTTTAVAHKFSYKMPGVDLAKPVADCGVVEETSKGLWGIFLLGFLGGLLALLTPCVFPMIPLTVSFFTKSSQDKKKGVVNAFFYGFFILLVYVLLSLPFHLLDNLDPNILNNISTNIWVNIFFFAIFVVFAISFFGYFEITLPGKWTNKADSASNVGGIIGIFFMALTLALVSFSCTGPILGSLLAGAISGTGGAMQLTMGMGGFGLALALPFALFAAFPGWLNSLPKSGGWLNTVKVVLGFVELALAVKFLSNADLVKHWGLVKIEVFLALWIIIGVLLTLYLFGKIRFPHDTPGQKPGAGKLVLSVITAAFVIYLASGFKVDKESNTFVSLSMLSGLAPPAGYSWLLPSRCPNALPCYHDYEEGLAAAKEENKPIIIDFTGLACVNCRKMEEHVWPKKGVVEKLRDDFILISLYVDDREMLPDSLQETYTTATGRVKKIRTKGDKWATLQTETFDNNSQPWYCLLSPDEQLLVKPVGYTPDVQEYINFLQCGLDANKSLHAKPR